jgi:hypothetical protein
MRIRRSCYRLHELSCFLYIFSLPFYFDICCFIAVTFAFLCQWPITTEFLKGVVFLFYHLEIAESDLFVILVVQCYKNTD